MLKPKWEEEEIEKSVKMQHGVLMEIADIKIYNYTILGKILHHECIFKVNVRMIVTQENRFYPVLILTF